ncbi:class II core domain (F) tRNA synthetase [Helicosporidium sp. ATCC 50920]|nr:class II core domain (F) tRNA synthetase [Helicosporidium sp. ATCC 50920]|eukprot:KDD75428.1 class II core domain (F) tRNA synthetase [Helicosporidium sp. ATCC 50920]
MASPAPPKPLDERILLFVSEAQDSIDSGDIARQLGLDAQALEFVGTIKSLIAHDMITAEDVDHFRLVLTAYGSECASNGSPEARFFAALPADGSLPLSALESELGATVGGMGFKQAMQSRWVSLDRSGAAPEVRRAVEAVEDTVGAALASMAAGEAPPPALLSTLRRRKLVAEEKKRTWRLGRGPKFALRRVKESTDLTAEMLASGSWREARFKAYNYDALGSALPSGALHPLLKVRTQFRKIFVSMGFQEMPTDNYVESSFWNFDALFQPQQHPARDAHDTFFLLDPAAAPLARVPAAYAKEVRDVHQRGGFGSAGYGAPWSEREAEKNLLRTHTTAVSSRMLYALAQEWRAAGKGPFKPARYFSIDRVFRNEAIDRTHLAEFHQIEGVVADVGLTLGHLIGTLKEFFRRMGMHELRFKPAYNPYTEPSMEIFAFSKELDKWMEVGNSGMFRPEMLRPMGFPENVNVIAWGLSLERPTMILYGIDNIRELFGHKVSLSLVKSNPICRMGL